MELWTIITIVLAVSVGLLAGYVYTMSSSIGVFRKLGINGPTPWPVLGTFHRVLKDGLFEFHLKVYQEFYNERVYGIYDTNVPVMVIKDLDMIKDITVKHFNTFVNRRTFNLDPPFDHAMTMLKDDHWKNVRRVVSPTFSTGKVKRMAAHVERNAHNLLEAMMEKQESGEEAELKDMVSKFTIDAIAGTGFGVHVNSFKDVSNNFQEQASKLLQGFGNSIALLFLFPFLITFLRKIGYQLLPKGPLQFFGKFVDDVMSSRLQEKGASKRSDFLQLMVDSMEEGGDGDNDNMTKEEADVLQMKSTAKSFSINDAQGQSIVFILAGYDTVSTAMSFALHLLATNPHCQQNIQKEIDEKLGGAFPDYDNVQSLAYLDMCINESIRLYPPGFIFDRVCNEDIDIQGVHIPKGMVVLVPANSIHRDPKYWTEPEKFDPLRFTPENKASRHPYAFLPFGQGPRNCIGMRLALLQMKVGIAAVLQKLTLVHCSKTAKRITLKKFALAAIEGLWVKVEKR